MILMSQLSFWMFLILKESVQCLLIHLACVCCHSEKCCHRKYKASSRWLSPCLVQHNSCQSERSIGAKTCLSSCICRKVCLSWCIVNNGCYYWFIGTYACLSWSIGTKAFLSWSIGTKACLSSSFHPLDPCQWIRLAKSVLYDLRQFKSISSDILKWFEHKSLLH